MQEPSADPPPEGGGVGPSLRIVVADHDPASCQFYRGALARLGHQVCVAGTGRQLVGQCRLLRPDLVIAAADLPDPGGLAAVEELCRERATPVVLVLPNLGGELARPALANPCVLACLHKPVKEADLATAVLVAQNWFERFGPLWREVTDLRQALEDRKLLERAKGLVMKYNGANEEEADRRLNELASAQGRTPGEVAQAVLAAGEVFLQLEQLAPCDRARDGHDRNADRAPEAAPRPRARRGEPLPRRRTPAPQNGEGSGGA